VVVVENYARRHTSSPGPRLKVLEAEVRHADLSSTDRPDTVRVADDAPGARDFPSTASVRRDSEGALRYGAATDRRKDLTTASKRLGWSYGSPCQHPVSVRPEGVG